MAYTADDVAALKSALARGVLTVKRGDEQVTYRSQDELRRQLEIMEAEVAGTSDEPRYPGYRPTFNRGL